MTVSEVFQISREIQDLITRGAITAELEEKAVELGMNTLRLHRSQRGVSLIEALVAMAVMAFGTLGVLGVQTTLRLNADIAKQRNEAVRIGQETIEAARSFELVRSDDANIDTWAGIVDAVVDPVLGYTVANTSYRVETRVEEAAGLHDPRGAAMR